ncbi:ABCC11, partial [Symbiodinium sp. KB8]
LNTVLHSDRILVLDSGKVAEFDSPQALLQKDGGAFKDMIESEGREKNHNH